MRTLRIDCGFEVKSANDSGRIQGYGSVFGNVDYGYDRIERGAFKDWIKNAFDGELPMLWQHSDDDPVGIWDDISENRNGLVMSGQLNLSKESGQPDVPTAWKALSLAKQGAVKGLSIGYQPIDYHFEEEVRVLEKIDLMETSMVTFPMNPLARVTAIKYATNRDFVQMLRENLGLSREAAEALRAGGLKELRRVVGSLQEGIEDESGSLQEGGLSDLHDTAEAILNQIRGITHGRPE